MKQHRNEVTTAGLANWPEFNPMVLTPRNRAIFNQRRTAIELYAGGETIKQIEAQTNVNRRQLYRLIERCMDTHADGRPFGFRALVRYARVAVYERVLPFKAVSTSGFGAAAGTFGLLLQAHPELILWLKEQVKRKRITVRQISTDGKLRTGLGNDAALLWNAFASLHHKHGLPGELEIPMDSFARAVEIVLKESELRDASNFRPDVAIWNLAVRSCGGSVAIVGLRRKQRFGWLADQAARL